MKSTILIPSLLVGAGASAIGIIVSQTSSYDPMSSFIEYEEDERTVEASIQKISDLIQNVKNAFETLKKTIETYERGFKDYKAISIDKEKIGDSKAKELARTNFLVSNLESLMEKEGLSDSEKERLQKEKDSLQEKIKEIEKEGKDYSNSESGKIEDISKLAGKFSEIVQKLYEELFLLFKSYRSLISKNIGINRKKSLSALLSTAEKVGLLETQENTNYISSGFQFVRTIDTSDEKLMTEINKNNDFTFNADNSTVVLKTINESMWDFFDWNSSGRKDLSDWKEIITGNK